MTPAAHAALKDVRADIAAVSAGADRFGPVPQRPCCALRMIDSRLPLRRRADRAATLTGPRHHIRPRTGAKELKETDAATPSKSAAPDDD